ncbi:MAG: hypothetical protein KGD64_04765 [Candidatus Heimdallarchaeota archaeon]|nr:hypothetical protein [Candidatus Heimdallarchaeota archaeon]
MTNYTSFNEAILRGWSEVIELDYENLLQPEIVIRIRDAPKIQTESIFGILETN